MKEVNKKVLSIFDSDYQNWIKELKTRYRQSQIKAAIRVNSEMIQFYWELGRDIVKMKGESKWGSGFYASLSKDLREELPDSFCFSIRNLQFMKQFYELFSEDLITKQVVSQIQMVPWGHLILIVRHAKGNVKKGLFFVQKTIENNWSRAMLLNFLDTDLYERSGKAVNNFAVAMPEVDSDLASDILKSPHSFNFLTIENRYREKELKDALIAHIQEFLLELGTGFAYVGREYRLQVGQTEQFLDMLFYNTVVHAYVVVEVKVTDFRPEYIGQLGTYVVAVDHILKTERDEKTIGILICKGKDDVLAKYSVDSSSQPLGISSYELSKLLPEKFESNLPSIEELEEELNRK